MTSKVIDDYKEGYIRKRDEYLASIKLFEQGELFTKHRSGNGECIDTSKDTEDGMRREVKRLNRFILNN